MFVHNAPHFAAPTPGVSDQAKTVSSSAVALVATAFNDATKGALVSVYGADIYITIDGSNPVAGSNGHVLPNGWVGLMSRPMATACKAIRAASTDATVHISEVTY